MRFNKRSAGSCTWVTTTPHKATGLGKSGWKATWGKTDLGLGVLTDSQQHEPAVCPGGQESQQHPDLYPRPAG